MKKVLLSVATLGCFVSAHAQWQPNSTAQTGNIYYDGGNVGVGTTTPQSKFEVAKFLAGPEGIMRIVAIGNTHGAHGPALIITPQNIESDNATNPYGSQGLYGDGLLVIKGQPTWHDGSGWRSDSKAINVNNAFVVQNRGHVVIGTPAPTGPQGDYKLNVWGRARANEIVVNTNGADFVFAKNYRLRPLEEVEQFITANNHLPEIPSAKEMQANGMAVGELQTKLLQKVEELTLYVIEQNKQLQELKKENQEMKEKVEKLK